MTQRNEAEDPAGQPPNLSPVRARWIGKAIRSLPILALIVIPFVVLSLLTALSDLRTYPGFDLRPKVVGARAVAASLDPYDLDAAGKENDFFKSTTTPLYTPALLMLYVPLSGLAFETQRVVYFCLDWFFAAGALYLLLRYLGLDRRRAYLGWIAFAIFILCSAAFRIHLERGQYYMLLLLLTFHVAASLKNHWTGWLSCLPAALLMVLRPTYGLILVFALASLGSGRWVFRVFALAAALFLLTLPWAGLHEWTEFAHVAGARQAAHITEMISGCSDPVPSSAGAGASNGPFVIEHIDFSNILPHTAINGTFIGLVSWISDIVNKVHRLTPAACGWLQWTSAVNTVLLLAILVGGAWTAWLARRRRVRRNVLVACVLLWPMLLEIFGPERFLYTAVLEVLPFLLLATDESVFPEVSAGASGTYRLVAFLALGLAPNVLFQVGNLGFLKQTLDSAAILLVLPCVMAIVCVRAILNSPQTPPPG